MDAVSPDFELTLQTLNYATRMLASELDAERLTNHALDTLADFGRSRQVALLTVHEEQLTVEVAGELSAGHWCDPERSFSYADTPLAEIIADRQMCARPLSAGDPLPLPAATGQPGRECFCLPLIGRHRQVLAVATLDRDAADPLSELDRQALNVVATLIAVSMENARLFHLATVDGLTGLYVRRYFEIRLAEELARLRRFGGVVGLVMTDIDHFKQLNDSYGHQAGDAVLRTIAAVTRQQVRQGLDVPCRYGGEEFVYILPETDQAGAMEVAERIREAVAATSFGSAGITRPVTISAGVAATYRDEPLSEQELIKRADTALYQAKEGGRNRVVSWSVG